MAYNTGNAIGSADARDLYDNAQNLDKAMNSTDPTWIDRFGVARPTFKGAESELNQKVGDAEAAATQALGYLNTMRATSYGPLAEDPATDPLGNPCTAGDEYFNTTYNLLKRFDGSAWRVPDINTTNLASGAGSSMVGHGGQTVEAALDERLPEIGSYAALDAYDGDATAVLVYGVTNIFDGGAGVFRRTTDTPTAANGIYRQDALNRWWKRDYSGVVNVKWFGAKGDGVTDDTAAFVAANTYLMTKPAPVTNQAVESHYVTLEMQSEGIYRISGHRIFGSQIPTGSNGTSPPKILNIVGNGASLVWDAQTENDELFYFDGTLANVSVKGLTIFVTNAMNVTTGAGILFRFYSNTSLSNQAHASKFSLKDVTIFPGRRTEGGPAQRPKWIFYNTGNAMCDQAYIENCRFWYMNKVWVGQNPEAVNITFQSCAFFGASGYPYRTDITPTTYFEFNSLYDNFNVVNCSFSLANRETILKTVATGNTPSQYNFNFIDNRYEANIGGAGAGFAATAAISGGAVTGVTVTNGGSGYTVAPVIEFINSAGYGATATATISGGVVTAVTVTNGGSGYTVAPQVVAKEYHVTLADMNFGTLNMTNSNFTLAANGTFANDIRLIGSARARFENVAFWKPRFYLPGYDGTYVGSGLLIPDAVEVDNCTYIGADGYEIYSTTAGTGTESTFTYPSRALSGVLVRGFRARHFGRANSQIFYDFEVKSLPAGGAVVSETTREITYTVGAVGVNSYITLPPYQAVTGVSVRSLPGGADRRKIRVYFGDKANGDYTDYEITNYDTVSQEVHVAFEGLATVFDQNIWNQKIYVAVLDGSGNEVTPSRCEVVVSYKPMRLDIMQLTTAPQTKVKRYHDFSKLVTTARRPSTPPYSGYSVFDSTIGKPIWWTGTVWKDATGTTV